MKSVSRTSAFASCDMKVSSRSCFERRRESSPARGEARRQNGSTRCKTGGEEGIGWPSAKGCALDACASPHLRSEQSERTPRVLIPRVASFKKTGGEGGIRTLGTLRHTRFP